MRKTEFDGRVSPSADPLILALEAWHLLSPRTRHCLEHKRDENDSASTVARVPIEAMRLSDLAKLEVRDLAGIPNLGRVCLCEIALLMERYGWSFQMSSASWQTMFDHPIFTGLPTLKMKVALAAERRQANFERSRAMLEAKERDGATAETIGKRFGASAAAAQISMQNARSILEQRTRYPLPTTH
ncbi:hypothetical protein [Sphingomonas oryzagri]